MIYDPPPLVEVIWEDAAGWNKWFEDADWKEHGVVTVRSLGFLLEKSRKVIKITMHKRTDDINGDLFCIPRGCVVQIRELEKFLKEDK